MPVGVKLIITVAALISAVPFLALVDKSDRGIGDSWFWRWGSNDSFRSAFMKPDGTLKKYTKAVWATFMVAWLCLIWLLPS